MEEMPRKSAAELEAECLRLLAMDLHTRGIKRVEIIRMYPKGTGPNWTYGALDPMPKRAGLASPNAYRVGLWKMGAGRLMRSCSPRL